MSIPHEINMNGPTLLETSPTTDALAAQLTAKGHTVQTSRMEGSGLHSIQKVKDGYVGAADPRRDGIALGD
jgi:gamma-glutamyltranspeptidase/glutathione hydrolase